MHWRCSLPLVAQSSSSRLQIASSANMDENKKGSCLALAPGSPSNWQARAHAYTDIRRAHRDTHVPCMPPPLPCLADLLENLPLLVQKPGLSTAGDAAKFAYSKFVNEQPVNTFDAVSGMEGERVGSHGKLGGQPMGR